MALTILYPITDLNGRVLPSVYDLLTKHPNIGLNHWGILRAYYLTVLDLNATVLMSLTLQLELQQLCNANFQLHSDLLSLITNSDRSLIYRMVRLPFDIFQHEVTEITTSKSTLSLYFPTINSGALNVLHSPYSNLLRRTV
jgi:hypothetical protein